jgi:Protein of unknown function (DUF4031)
VTVLIDPPVWPAHGRLWSHLVSDASFAELHAFAQACGVPERAFEGDHYDVPQDRWSALVRAGAQPVTGRELLFRLQGAGLRRPKRRGERVIGSQEGPDGTRVDVVASLLAPLHRVSAVLAFVAGAAGVLAVRRDGGWVLPRLRTVDPLGSAPVGWQQVGYLRHQRVDGRYGPMQGLHVERVVRPPDETVVRGILADGDAVRRLPADLLDAEAPVLGWLLAAVPKPFLGSGLPPVQQPAGSG